MKELIKIMCEKDETATILYRNMESSFETVSKDMRKRELETNLYDIKIKSMECEYGNQILETLRGEVNQ